MKPVFNIIDLRAIIFVKPNNDDPNALMSKKTWRTVMIFMQHPIQQAVYLGITMRMLQQIYQKPLDLN